MMIIQWAPDRKPIFTYLATVAARWRDTSQQSQLELSVGTFSLNFRKSLHPYPYPRSLLTIFPQYSPFDYISARRQNHR